MPLPVLFLGVHALGAISWTRPLPISANERIRRPRIGRRKRRGDPAFRNRTGRRSNAEYTLHLLLRPRNPHLIRLRSLRCPAPPPLAPVPRLHHLERLQAPSQRRENLLPRFKRRWILVHDVHAVLFVLRELSRLEAHAWDAAGDVGGGREDGGSVRRRAAVQSFDRALWSSDVQVRVARRTENGRRTLFRAIPRRVIRAETDSMGSAWSRPFRTDVCCRRRKCGVGRGAGRGWGAGASTGSEEVSNAASGTIEDGAEVTTAAGDPPGRLNDPIPPKSSLDFSDAPPALPVACAFEGWRESGSCTNDSFASPGEEETAAARVATWSIWSESRSLV